MFDSQIKALSDGGWVVIYASLSISDGYGLYQQVYTGDGTTVGTETKLAELDGPSQVADVRALPNDGWVVTWTTSSGSDSQEIYQRTFWLNDVPTVENTVADRQADEDDAFSFTFAADTFGDANQFDTLT